jgi:hypothetical protein
MHGDAGIPAYAGDRTNAVVGTAEATRRLRRGGMPRTVALAALLLCLCGASLRAQSARIPWQTMSEGLGRQADAGLVAVGVAGQVLAGRSADGNTVLGSGFLAGLRTSYAGAVFAESPSTGPDGFLLSQNHPNPFHPVTTIRYTLRARSYVELRIFDALGRLVSTLVHSAQTAGDHTARWDAAGLPAGTYVYRIDARALDGSVVCSDRKVMVLMR